MKKRILNFKLIPGTLTFLLSVLIMKNISYARDNLLESFKKDEFENEIIQYIRNNITEDEYIKLVNTGFKLSDIDISKSNIDCLNDYKFDDNLEQFSLELIKEENIQLLVELFNSENNKFKYNINTVDYEKEIDKNAIVLKDSVLKDVSIKGDLIINPINMNKEIELINVDITGNIYIESGSIKNLYLVNSKCNNIENYNKNINIILKGNSLVSNFMIFESVYIDTINCENINNIKVTVSESIGKFSDINLKGNFENIDVNGTWINLKHSDGIIKNIYFNENIENNNLYLTDTSIIKKLIINSPLDVHNRNGSIVISEINSDNVKMIKRPDIVAGIYNIILINSFDEVSIKNKNPKISSVDYYIESNTLKEKLFRIHIGKN